jgi:hypothetical protein
LFQNIHTTDVTDIFLEMSECSGSTHTSYLRGPRFDFGLESKLPLLRIPAFVKFSTFHKCQRSNSDERFRIFTL